MTLGARRSEPNHVTIARRLGVAIVSGELSPGDTLPREIDLALQRGVSRNVIRESLRMLTAKGLVYGRPRAGTKVQERSRWNMLDPELLEWMFESEPPAAFLNALHQLRMIVEPAAAELAARQRDARHLSRLGYAMEQMSIHGLAGTVGQEADEAFHHVILEATGNELLVGLSSTVRAAVRFSNQNTHRMRSRPRDPELLHRDLFDAIADADADAARAAAVNLIRNVE